MSTIPKDWSVKNGAFIGYVMVAAKVETRAFGVPEKPGDDWLPFAHDLRSIDSLKQPTHEDPDATALYHGNAYVGTVNATMHELLPHWLKVRHAYDQMIVAQEGQNIDKELLLR